VSESRLFVRAWFCLLAIAIIAGFGGWIANGCSDEGRKMALERANKSAESEPLPALPAAETIATRDRWGLGEVQRIVDTEEGNVVYILWYGDGECAIAAVPRHQGASVP
jgi:hypothetical protein